MIAAVAFGALGFVFVVVAWSRFGSGRSQRRSVEEHQRALDVLGEVAKRRDGIAPVHAPSAQEIGRAHVHPDGERGTAVPRDRPGAGATRTSPRSARAGFRADASSNCRSSKTRTKRARAERLQGDEVDGATRTVGSCAHRESGAVGLDHVVRFDALGSCGRLLSRRPFPPASDDDALLGFEAPSAHEGRGIGGTRSLEGLSVRTG